MPLALGVVVVLAVVWGGIRLFGAKPTSPPASQVASANPEGSVDEPSAALTEQGTSPQQNNVQGSGTHEVGNASTPANARSPANAMASANAKMSANARTPVNAKLTANTKASGKTPHAAAPITARSAAVREVLPDVPQRARRTIRGNVKVSIRVIVEQDGTVFAALVEHRGPSRYFERLAIDAAKKWTFPPADHSAQRLMLVSFAFNRDGTTAEAVPL